MQQMPILARFIAVLLFSGGAELSLGAGPGVREAGSGPLRPCLAAAPLSASSSQETMNFTVEGKISKHAGQKLTLSTENNIIFHVAYSEKTSITRQDGSAGTAKDLRVGTRIYVEGELTEAGEIIAHRITIQSASPGEKR